MRVRYGIFDLDGTLLDSMYIWEHAADRFLEKHGREAPAHLLETLKPMSLTETAEYLNAAFHLEQTTQTTIEEIKAGVAAEYDFHAALKPGVKAFLQEMRRRGARLCVATASEEEHVEAALRRLGVRGYFEGIVTCTGVGAGKTDPRVFLEAARLVGAPSPQEAVVFEDALHAILTAKGAGFRVVAVEDPSAEGNRKEIRQAADCYLKSFLDWEWDK